MIWLGGFTYETRKTQSPWYIASGSPDPHAPVDLFSARDPQKHAALRRVVANLYSMTTLVKLEPYIDECSELLIEKFTQFAHTRRTLDMAHWMQCYAFDVIGNITVSPFALVQILSNPSAEDAFANSWPSVLAFWSVVKISAAS